MEKNNFIWIFFVATLVVGTFLGIAYTNITMTGKAASENQNVILPVSCIDSDGGWNLQVKGTCRDGNVTNYTDMCEPYGGGNQTNLTVLREYFCMSGRCSSSLYHCDVLGGKCVNGACSGNATNYSAIITESSCVASTGDTLIKLTNPAVTLNQICGPLIDDALKRAATYTDATHNACWPYCFLADGKVSCNEGCPPGTFGDNKGKCTYAWQDDPPEIICVIGTGRVCGCEYAKMK